MKRVICLTLALICLLGLAGCGKKKTSTTATQEEWKEAQEVLDLLPPSDLLGAYELVATVAAGDSAYDRAGVALFTDAERTFSLLAFMAADGSYEYCSFDAPPIADCQLTYIGGGAATFRVEGDNGPHICQISMVPRDGAVSFDIEILPGVQR